MITATILRDPSTDAGTFGTLSLTRDEKWNRLTLQSLEPPWRDNAVDLSCIKPGTYKCEVDTSPRWGRVYYVREVDGRTHILFHLGNWAADKRVWPLCDSLGCIMPGFTRAIWSTGQPMVTSSRAALRAIYGFTNMEPFELIITGV